MIKSIISRLMAIAIMLILAFSTMGVVFAADFENNSAAYPIEQIIQNQESQPTPQGSSPTDPTNSTWPTLSQAKSYYGSDWIYTEYGYNYAGGYWIYYYTFSDNSRNYFYVLSLA